MDSYNTLCVDYWREIRKLLEIFFQTRIIINPLLDENALISLDQGLVEDFINEPERWQEMGPFHLKFEKWDRLKNSQPLVMKGCSRWLRIGNLPLDY